MKFCRLVVHDLTNDISHDNKLNRRKNVGFFVLFCFFLGGGVKILEIPWQKREKWEKYFVVSIFFNILVQNFAQWSFIY